MYARVHNDSTFANLCCWKIAMSSAFRITYIRVRIIINLIYYNESLLYEKLEVLEHSDELLFLTAVGFQEYCVLKPRPSIAPVLASVELLLDDEDEVLSKFGGTLVPKISKLLLSWIHEFVHLAATLTVQYFSLNKIRK